MYKVVYFQYGTKYVDTVDDLSELSSYEEATQNGTMWYDCTIDYSYTVVDAGYASGWTIGEFYDEDLGDV